MYLINILNCLILILNGKGSSSDMERKRRRFPCVICRQRYFLVQQLQGGGLYSSTHYDGFDRIAEDTDGFGCIAVGVLDNTVDGCDHR